MKIQSVQNYNTSFNGLWGKSFRKTDIDPTLNITTVKSEYYYYPFSDEAFEDVQDVVRDNSFADIINNKYVINECKICARTPFTTKQFLDYSKAKKFIPEFKPVDEYSQTKYITYDYNNQLPARNMNFVA